MEPRLYSIVHSLASKEIGRPCRKCSINDELRTLMSCATAGSTWDELDQRVTSELTIDQRVKWVD